MKFIIRKAEKKDVPEMFRLINELALYEKAPQEVKLTLEELENDGFGPNPIYTAFVAEGEGKILGMALYYVKYSTWKGRCVFLEDLVVSQQYRRFGVGAKLFDAVVKAAKEMGVRKMDWQILDWNEPAINFYKKYNTVFSDEWLNGSLYEKQLKEINV